MNTQSSSTRPLRVLVAGGLGPNGTSGGREHALAWAAARSPRCSALFVAPGNAGTPGVSVPAGTELVKFCQDETIDLVLVGPDATLAEGLVDCLTAAGIRAFGPTQAAAELEWSKAFTRAFCERHGIASPISASFDGSEVEVAVAWARSQSFSVVVKADGLAAGKGVILPENADETEQAIRDILVGGAFGVAGNRVVLEERLVGEEVSLFAFCDGKTAVAMPPAQDHKRAYEGDVGPNTGGMGAYAPAPVCSPELAAELTTSVLQTTVDGMAAEGRPFHGVLYAGLMLTDNGPRLLEFNCRFGDPEAQVLLPLLDSDLLDIAEACVEGTLTSDLVQWKPMSAVTVVLASAGYPGSITTGRAITGLDIASADETLVFLAGAVQGVADGDGVGSAFGGNSVVTSGGRVLAVTGLGLDVRAARARAYEGVAKISFEGATHRRDIAWRALARTTGGYAASGVDIDAGAEAVNLLKASVESTHSPAVLAGVGAFGGVFDAAALVALKQPVLVASTDGVGTKVALAAEAGRLGGVGEDLVNHCVNDILVQNARPLFFLDYIASAKLIPSQVADIVSGMSKACRENSCALLGGETAEMPGVYHDGHVDVAGTVVGMAERGALLPLDSVGPGDVLLGLQSSGPHTNGYSLLRRIFEAIPLDSQPAPLDRPLGDALLEPHRSYLPILAPLLDGEFGPLVKGLVHLTGGGFQENIPRILPPGCGADIELNSWPMPPLFQLVRTVSGLSSEELHRTLNMGIGMLIVVAPEHVAQLQSALSVDSWVVGRLVSSANREVTLR